MEYSRLRRLSIHDLTFLVFLAISVLLFRRYLEALVRLSLGDDRYSHIVLIPILSAGLIYLQRKNIFVTPRYSVSMGMLLLGVGVGLFCVARLRLLHFSSNDGLSAVMSAIVLVWIAGFLLCYGAPAFRTALFSLLFLILMIPIPSVALDKIVLALQEGSAVMTYGLYKLLGVPVLWQHFKFLLPGVEIEIAKECSGVRSSSALFITSILAGHLFLQSIWRRALFSFLTIPIVIFKNAVRIVTISCLGVYVNPGFLHGSLHRYGGLPFSLISLAILVPLLLTFQKREYPQRQSNKGRSEVSKQALSSRVAF